ncbi:MAG: M48 family metalloprotease [Candidatus Poribacteria bacterium]
MKGCTTISPQSKQELIIRNGFEDKFEKIIGFKLARQVETRLSLKNDSEVLLYLSRLTETLMESLPDLRIYTVSIYLINGNGGNDDLRWRNFSLPGNRIYLSTELLKKIDFENEIAATIAFELGHLLGNDAMNSIDNIFEAMQGRAVLFGKDGILEFTDDEHIKAIEQAIEILYKTGFDPRGMISFLNMHKDNLNRSFLTESSIDQLMAAARKAIAQHAPLRNPIIRSSTFLAIHKRIKGL